MAHAQSYSDLEHVSRPGDVAHKEAVVGSYYAPSPSTVEDTYKGQSIPLTSETKSRRGIPLLWLAVAILAFLIGGGVGGGIAAGVMSGKKDVSKSCSALESSAPTAAPTAASNGIQTAGATATVTTTTTTTATAATATATETVKVNAGGCPLNNGTTYTSSVSTSYNKFTILCDTDVTSGTQINGDGVYASSLNDCLDACAAYSKNSTATAETGMCLGIAWLIQFPADMPRNGMCYFKGGRTTSPITDGHIGIGAILQS